MARYWIGIVFLLYLSGCAVNQELIIRARKAGVPVVITDIFPDGPNSIGGVNVVIYFLNTSDKPIKYITYEVVPYNRVRDIVGSEIGGKRKASLRKTGPIAPNEKSRAEWKNVWYNSTIECARLTGMNIDFMDGSTASVGPEKINEYFRTGLWNFGSSGRCATKLRLYN